MYINNLGHMTKMVAMPIYCKNPSKIFYSGNGGPIQRNFAASHEASMAKVLQCVYKS